jgi:glycosyltransferase involved in cell wall biosynthesis
MTAGISVLMSVYNGERFLREAVESILSQTWTDFEFIIVDDGSTDGSVEIVESYADTRLRLVHNNRNLGLSQSLNRGLEEAGGRYVARMDADDISLPERFERQMSFMDAHPEVGACGTWAKDIDDSGQIVAEHRTIVDKRLDCYYWIPSPIVHPTAMIRTELLKRLKYNPDVRYAQDFNLWLRIVKAGFKLANLAEFLFLYRVHPMSISESKLEAQLLSSYESFRAHISPCEISQEAYLEFFYGECGMGPMRRVRIMSELARAIHVPYRRVFPDDVRYAAKWLRQRGYEYVCETPALQPLRRMGRQLRSFLS